MMENIGASIELEWVEHTNNVWAQKNCDDIVNRDIVQSMYGTLLLNKEIRIIPTTLTSYNDVQHLPIFQYDPVSPIQLNQYIKNLLNSQLELAREVCSATAFSIILKQRLVVLKRICYALSMKYHDKEKNCTQNLEQPLGANSLLLTPREVTSGSHALLELGVKTGLSLLFSLLQQNWQVSSILGIPSLCNSVLKNTVDLIQKLPPLSLSNDSQLTNLGCSSLDQVCDFLKNAILNEAAADNQGKVLAAEILLELALQRGSLHYLLEWIETALEASCKDPKLSSKQFKNSIIQIGGKNKLELELLKNKQDEINIYQAGYCLMEVLVSLALDYIGMCSGTGSLSCESDVIPFERSDVYVWGSNSSHQLAEGSQEKILLPIKSNIFNQVQQVNF